MATTDEIIAKLILSTKRKNREYDLVEIAESIDLLRNKLGSLKDVSDVIGISPGMLNQFLKVFKLSEPLKQLVRDRKIDSVNMVHNLSKFDEHDQNRIAVAIVEKRLNSEDLRFLSPLRTELPNESIDHLIDKTISSKNIKVSVIMFHTENLLKDVHKLEEQLVEIIGRDNLLSISVKPETSEIKLTKNGEKQLRELASRRKITLQELMGQMLS
jgi:hypothetical protein